MKILAQIFGTIALLLMFASYQKKNKKDFLYLQVFANLSFGIQYLVLNAISAFTSSILSIVRTLVFYNKEKNDKKISISILIIFEAAFIVFGIITYNNYYSIIPVLIACVYTYGTWQKNLKVTYAIGVIVSILWIYYNYMVGAYVAIFGSTFELVASLLGLRGLLKKRLKEKIQN